MGQQPPHYSQTKCFQHPSTQGQNSVFNPRKHGQGTTTHQNSPPPLPVPAWALNHWEHKFNHPNQAPASNTTNTSSNSTNNSNYKTTIVVPYIPKTADKFKKLCDRRGIQVHFKGTNALRTALGNPKDKDPKTNQTGIIYQYQCPHINCPSSCIGESGRSLGERVKEHFKAPSPIHLHSTTTGHPMNLNQLILFTRR